MLNGAILAGGIHGLENTKNRPAILRVKLVLHLGQTLNALLQQRLGGGFLHLKPGCIARIIILQAKASPLDNAIAIQDFCNALFHQPASFRGCHHGSRIHKAAANWMESVMPSAQA
jgi:hypothetical protein